jgi:hypothetical protein
MEVIEDRYYKLSELRGMTRRSDGPRLGMTSLLMARDCCFGMDPVRPTLQVGDVSTALSVFLHIFQAFSNKAFALHLPKRLLLDICLERYIFASTMTEPS